MSDDVGKTGAGEKTEGAGETSVFKRLFDDCIEHGNRGESPLLLMAIFRTPDGGVASCVYRSTQHPALLVGELERLKLEILVNPKPKEGEGNAN